MRIDPLLRMALTLFENKGAYALLLGSGISRSAGIPTGYEVLLDLIRRLAILTGQDAGESPESWFKETYGGSPSYSKLIQELAPTPAERRGLLQRYFEPTDEERDQGLKTPTKAHEHIASLVKSGYVRVILTTNFDRLLESALQDVGVTPALISSEDAFKGAAPYVHEDCVVVKLHGDYRDARIKNTSSELRKYSERTNGFLDRVFDEFGVVVCGWSGEHDEALRAAVLRCASRRYSWFWLTRSTPRQDAAELIEARRAAVINVASADSAFERLHELATSLEEEGRSHPISTRVAVATAKRYLSEPRFRIDLQELVTDETKELVNELHSDKFGSTISGISYEDVQQRARTFERLTERLGSVLSAVAFYGGTETASLLSASLERAITPKHYGGQNVLLELQYYPALLLAYQSGISALSAHKFANLAAILAKPRIVERQGEAPKPITYHLNTWSAMNGPTQKTLPRPKAEHEYTPLSEHLFELMQPLLADYMVTTEEFEHSFDCFEYFLSLVYADKVERGWQPWGTYSWRWRGVEWAPADDFFSQHLPEILKAGFFSGEEERFATLNESHKDWLRKLRQW